jgi:hypothetical protein
VELVVRALLLTFAWGRNPGALGVA